MNEQFYRMAAELGRDVEQQIAALDAFVARFGACGQLDAHLVKCGRTLGANRDRVATRNAIVDFVATLPGAQSALARHLQQLLRERHASAEPAAAAPVREPRGSLLSRLFRAPRPA